MRLVVALCLALAVLPAAATAALLAALEVVAAENFWGSIAAQLGGNRAKVRSIVVDPATDPHSYEPTASDARTLAGAKVAIVNGIGYDNWASQLLAANAGGGRVVVDVGDVLGLGDGDNPHQWYSPASVRQGGRRDHRRLHPGGPRRRALLRGPEARVRDARLSRATTRCARDPPPLCRRARRLQREHLRAARRRASVCDC